MSSFVRFFVALFMVPVAALAEVPRVVTDIAPVQSLVAGIMRGVGKPDLLIQPGVSPHGYAMRPSEARALQDADLVVWIGPSLAPALEKSIETLAGHAEHLMLLKTQGTRLLPFREGVLFEHEEHGEDGHDDHATDDHEHDHEGIDPHAWLDPVNAQIWVQAISGQLSEIDPGNATLYDSNAAALMADLQALTEQTRDRLAPLSDRHFVVFHDAYQYFEARFGLTMTGAMLHGDGTPPSAGRLHALHEALAQQQVQCIFTEPQFNPGIIDAVSGQGDIAVAELDPMGVDLPLGDGLYQHLIARMADQIATCLQDAG